MIDTAGTLTKGAQAIHKHGAKSVFAVATHPVLSGPAVERIQDSVFTKVIVADTIPLQGPAAECEKFGVLSVAGLFAEAIRSIHFDDSISRLFLTS